MPLDLPGFYFDPERNRHFPLSSKPKPPPQPLRSQFPVPGEKHEKCSWGTRNALLEGQSHRLQSRRQHQMHCTRIASTSRAEASSTGSFGPITALCSTDINGEMCRFMGDNRGWLYSNCNIEEPHKMDSWVPLLTVHPGYEVSSISTSGRHLVVTGLGPLAKIAVQDLNVASRTMLITLGKLHDIWTSHLHQNGLVLGLAKKAVFLPDVDQSLKYQTLNTSSDVFAIERDESVVYTGSRNGTIQLFDIRTEGSCAQSLFGGTQEANSGNSSVYYLRKVHGNQLLASHTNGYLCTFDIRFPRSSQPTMVFPGHVNSFTRQLGITVDLLEDFVFAAGDDRRIRGWSLRTGEPLWAEKEPSSHGAMGLFKTPFISNIPALDLVQESSGPCLWAALGDTLHQFYLGQRSETGS